MSWILGATAAAFDDRWLRTGDLVKRDSDDFLRFQGRVKQIILRGGSNISPQEVEEALYRHPAVLESGVIAMPSDEISGALWLQGNVGISVTDVDHRIPACYWGFFCFSCATSSKISFTVLLPSAASARFLRALVLKMGSHNIFRLMSA